MIGETVFSGLLPILPEITLFSSAILILIMDIFHKGASPRAVTAVAIFGLFLALVMTLGTFSESSQEVFSNTLLIDPVSQFFKMLLIFSAAMTVLLAWMSTEVHQSEKAEIHALVVLGTLSMCIVASAVHFLLLFLAFEAAAIACYVLAAFKRRSAISSEAGVKLFVHGALTTILFAIGIVMLYGVTKTFNMMEMREQLAQVSIPLGYLWVAFGLIFAAVAARMAVFPFHFLGPDVVQGAPSPVSAFVSVSANVMSVAFVLRLCVHVFSSKSQGSWQPLTGFDWPELVAGVAAVSMTLGNLAALHQTNLKRLVGYSCIAQMGYVLLGLAVVSELGIVAVLFSLAAYGIVTLGTFFIIQMITDEKQSEDVSVLRGLVWDSPYEGVVLCTFLLSLAGLPPLVGFVGKFYMLGVVVREKLYWLSIVAAANWVIGLSYYLFMIRQVFATKSQKPGHLPMVVRPAAHAALAVLLFPTLALGIYWDPLMNSITRFLSAVMW